MPRLNPRGMALVALVGFMLSFLLALVARAPFGTVLLRAFISALVCATMAAVVQVLSATLLRTDSADDTDTGKVVDITVDDGDTTDAADESADAFAAVLPDITLPDGGSVQAADGGSEGAFQPMTLGQGSAAFADAETIDVFDGMTPDTPARNLPLIEDIGVPEIAPVKTSPPPPMAEPAAAPMAESMQMPMFESAQDADRGNTDGGNTADGGNDKMKKTAHADSDLMARAVRQMIFADG